MKLYYDPVTVNCRKVVAGFKLMGADFEEAKVDYFAGGHKRDDYSAGCSGRPASGSTPATSIWSRTSSSR